MNMKLPDIPRQPTPKGKRSVRWNIYGNWVGYVSGRRFKEFGCGVHAEQDANEWLNEKEDSDAS